MKTLNITFATLIALVQLAVPASMLWGRERRLREGALHRFRAELVGPYDAFSGRYVPINVGAVDVPWIGEPTASDRCFAILARDADGNSTVIAARASRPNDGADYVRARYWPGSAPDRVSVLLPIERFYLPEGEAPDAETLYRACATRGSAAAVVIVRVRNGDLVIEDLLIDNIPIRTHLHSPSDSQSQSNSESELEARILNP